MLTQLPVAGQVAGAVCVLVGLFLILPVGWFLVAAGALVVATGTAAEILQGRRSAPSDRRGGDEQPGVE